MLFASNAIGAPEQKLSLAKTSQAKPAQAKPATSKATPVKTYVLTQRGSVLGHVNTYVCSNAIRIELPDNRCYLVAAAPDWRVVLYNPDKKCAMDMSLEQFEKHEAQYSYLPQATEQTEGTWPKIKSGMIRYANIDAARFVLPTNPRLKVANPATPNHGYYIVLERKDIPREATRVMAKLFYQSKIPGLPLNEHISTDGLNGKKSNSFLDLRGDYSHLSTQKVKEELVSSDFFKYPTGFKKVLKEIDVLTDQSRLQQIEDMTNEMGVGR